MQFGSAIALTMKRTPMQANARASERAREWLESKRSKPRRQQTQRKDGALRARERESERAEERASERADERFATWISCVQRSEKIDEKLTHRLYDRVMIDSMSYDRRYDRAEQSTSTHHEM